jgi:hypothetical protein
MAALTVVVLAHGSWLAAVRVSCPPPLRAHPIQPMVTLAVDAGGRPSAEVRRIWSPVLFSLPEPAGFSRSLSGEGVLKPPVRVPDDPPPYQARVTFPSAAAVLTSAGAVVPRPLPLVQRSPAIPAPRSSVEPVEIPAGCARLPPEWVFPLGPEAAGNQPWEAVVRLVFHSDGLPRSALVEEGTLPDAARAALARAMFGWRCPAPNRERVETGDQQYRIRVRYEPPAAGE